MKKHTLLVIVPARNEESSVGDIVRSVRRALPGTPVLVIDDHSGDRTAQAASDAGARVVRLARHMGLAGCLRTGYRMALDEGFERVVRVDADGQHEAADIPLLLDALERTGAVMRWVKVSWGGRMADVQNPCYRYRAAAAAHRSRVGKNFHDPTSGFIGVNRRALELLANSSAPPYPEIGALIALRRNSCLIHEVACRMYPRRAGRSSMTFLRRCATSGMC